MNEVLYLITARGGSKGVPRKNIKEIGGLPLIAYKIRAAQRCKHKGRLIVSTEDQEIADIAKSYGAEVPFMRPEYLSSDTASSIDVILHALDWIDKNDAVKYKYLCLLEPSSPFARPEDLTNAIDLIIEKKALTCLGMKKADVATCFVKSLDDEGKLSHFYESIMNLKNVRRQDQKEEYTMNGCLYISDIEYFKENRILHSLNSVPYIMDDIYSIEIDSILNYEFAKFCVDKGYLDISPWL